MYIYSEKCQNYDKIYVIIQIKKICKLKSNAND